MAIFARLVISFDLSNGVALLNAPGEQSYRNPVYRFVVAYFAFKGSRMPEH